MRAKVAIPHTRTTTLSRLRSRPVRSVLANLTDEQLAGVTRPVTEPGYPEPESFPVRRCLGAIRNEESVRSLGVRVRPSAATSSQFSALNLSGRSHRRVCRCIKRYLARHLPILEWPFLLPTLQVLASLRTTTLR